MNMLFVPITDIHTGISRTHYYLSEITDDE